MNRILILLTLCLLFSCENEDIIPEPILTPLITIDSENADINSGKRFYFVTTLEGKFLGFKQIEGLKINVLHIESAEIPDKFNVHRLYIFDNSDIQILESFFNTDQTLFTHKPVCESTFEKIGNCSINITGPTYEVYILSYPGGSYSSTSPSGIYSIHENLETILYNGYNFLFTFLKKDQQYYYKYFFDLSPTETYSFQLDPTTMETNFNLKVLNAPEGIFFTDESNIQSVILSNTCFYRGTNLYNEVSNNAKTLSIFATPIDNEKYYKCNIIMQDENGKEYTYLRNGELPEFIPSLDCDITSANMDYDDIEITTNGSFDFIYGYYRVESDNVRNWFFYSDDDDMIKFPDIPAEITEQYPTLISSTFFETSTVKGEISLFEYSDINNYSDYMSDLLLNKYLGENSTLQRLTVRNY